MKKALKSLLSFILAFAVMTSVTAEPLYDVLDYMKQNNIFVMQSEKTPEAYDTADESAVGRGADTRRTYRYLVKVVDGDDNLVTNAKLEWEEMGKKSSVIASDGTAYMTSTYSPYLTVTAPGYQSVTVASDRFSEKTVNVVKMSSNYSINSVYYTYWSNGTLKEDVLYSTHVINRIETVGKKNSFYDFYLHVSSSGTSELDTYNVYCESTLIKSSKEGVICVNTENITDGGTLYLEAKFKDGGSVKKKLYLKVKDNSQKTSVSIGFDSINLTLPESLSWLGSASVALPPIPFSLCFSEDEVRVGIGVSRDVLNSKDKFDSFMDDFEKYKDEVKKGVEGLRSIFQKERLMNYMKGSDGKGMLPGFKKKVDITIAGYATAKFDAWGKPPNSLSGELILTINANGSFSWQTMVSVIPVVIDISGGVKATLDAGFTVADIIEENPKFEGELNLTIEPYLKVFAGIGIKKVASLGVYGGVNIPIKICLLNTDRSKMGVSSIDLKGKMGVQANILFLTYTKELLSKNWNIYTRENSIAKTTAIRNEVMSSSSYSLEQDIIESVMNVDNYTAEQTGSNTLTITENNQGVIAENISPFSDADFITYDETTILAAVNTDTARGKNNQSYIVTSVHSDGKWSEPVAVNNTGYAEFSPRLYKSGDDIYLVYQQATELFGDDADAGMVAGSVGIALSKLDKETMTFKDTKLIYGEEGYNSALATGEGYAVWYHNEDGDPFGNVNHNNIVIFDGKECRFIKEDLSHILSLKIGRMSDKTYIAYTVEGDGNYETNGDTKLYIVDVEGGEPVLVKTGNIEALQFTGYNDGILVWQEGEKLYSIGEAGQEASYFADSDVNNLFCVLDDGSICYVGKPTPQGDSVFYVKARHGKELTSPFEYDTVSENVGRMIAKGNTILCSLSDGNEAFEICKLYMKTITDKKDLRLNYISVDPHTFLKDNTIPAEVYVTNNGSYTVDTIQFDVVDRNGNVIEKKIIGGAELEPGTERMYNVSISNSGNGVIGNKVKFRISELVAENSLSAAGEESAPEDNTYTVDLGVTDIHVYMDDYISSTENQLHVFVMNENHVPASGTAKVTDVNGNVIYSHDFENLTAENPVHFDLDEDEIIGEGELSKLVTVTVETNGAEDNFDHNNTESHHIVIECPVQLKCSESDENFAVLVWDEASSSYGVEIEQLIDNSWQEIAVLDDASVGTYTVKNLDMSSENYFRIILTKSDGEEVQRSRYSETVEVAAKQESNDPETSDPETSEPESDDQAKPAPDTGAAGISVLTGLALALTGVAVLSRRKK